MANGSRSDSLERTIQIRVLAPHGERLVGLKHRDGEVIDRGGTFLYACGLSIPSRDEARGGGSSGPALPKPRRGFSLRSRGSRGRLPNAGRGSESDLKRKDRQGRE
jgi:hypothetical protein